MKTLSFPTIKLGEHIKQIRLKVKDTELNQDDLTVYGVTNTEGVSITNNKASDDLGNYIVLNEHQFAYNPYRINVGSIGLTPKGTFGIVSPAYVVFETDEQIDSEFLLYYLKRSIGINLIKWYGDRGGVRAALRYSDLEKIDFPNISLEKQLSILSKIKKIESKSELIVSEITNGDVGKLRQSILQQAVEGKLCEQNSDDEPASVLLEKIKKEKDKLVREGKIKKNKNESIIFRRDNFHYEKRGNEEVCIDDELPFKIPASWELIRLNDIGIYRKGPFGSSLTKSMFVPKSASTVKVYEQKNAIQKDHKLGEYYITREYFDEKMSGFAVSPGDILVSCAGTIGETYVLPDNIEEGIINQALMRMTIFDPIDIDYFLLYFNYVLKATAKKNSKGSAIKNIPPFEIFKKLLLPLPPLQEQQRIVEKVDRLMLLCDELEKEVNAAQQYASQLMESVLQEAFSTDKPISEEQSKQKCKVIPIQSKQEIELHFAMAARGNIKQSTLESLQKRAIEIANGEK